MKSIEICKLGMEDPGEVLHIQDIITGKKIASEETSPTVSGWTRAGAAR